MAKRPQRKKVVFVINPGAGQRAAAKLQPLAHALFPAGQWALEFVELHDWRETYPLALQAARRGAWAVVAVGGDGTINQVSQALAGSACRLGVIAAGTGNGFARGLGLPLDPVAACKVIAAGRTRKLDHAVLEGGRGFANVLGLGWDSWIAVRANQLRWLNRIHGFLRYVAAALLTLAHLRPQHVLVQMGRTKVQGRFMVVAVANGPQYGFGCTISPSGRMDDGKLDVVLMPLTGPVTFMRNAVRLFTQEPLLGAAYYRTAQASIRSLEGRELPIHLDGEPGSTTPATVKVQAKALTVLVP